MPACPREGGVLAYAARCSARGGGGVLGCGRKSRNVCQNGDVGADRKGGLDAVETQRTRLVFTCWKSALVKVRVVCVVTQRTDERSYRLGSVWKLMELGG